MTYGYARNAHALYRQNTVGGVEDADPHRLIGMLLEGAVDRINQAVGFMTFGNVPAKGQAISRAVAILAELRISLDHKAAPELSRRLDSLYDYVTRRLLEAQLHDQRDVLLECASLLTPIREAWEAIRPQYLSGARAPAEA